MFFTRFKKNKNAKFHFSKDIFFRKEFFCFSDVLTSRYCMTFSVYSDSSGKLFHIWKFNNYPFTPSGIFYNIRNRYDIYKTIKSHKNT